MAKNDAPTFDSLEAKILQYQFCCSKTLRLVRLVQTLIARLRSSNKAVSKDAVGYLMLQAGVLFNVAPSVYDRSAILLRGGTFNASQPIKCDSSGSAVSFDCIDNGLSGNSQAVKASPSTLHSLQLFEVLLINMSRIYDTKLKNASKLRVKLSNGRPDDCRLKQIVANGIFRFPELSCAAETVLAAENDLDVVPVFSKAYCEIVAAQIDSMKIQLEQLLNVEGTSLTDPYLMHRGYVVMLRLADLYCCICRTGKKIYRDNFQLLSRFARNGNEGLQVALQGLSRLFMQKGGNKYLIRVIDRYTESADAFYTRLTYLEDYLHAEGETESSIIKMVELLTDLKVQWTRIQRASSKGKAVRLKPRAARNVKAAPKSTRPSIRQVSVQPALAPKPHAGANPGIAAARAAATEAKAPHLSAGQRFQQKMLQEAQQGKINFKPRLRNPPRARVTAPKAGPSIARVVSGYAGVVGGVGGLSISKPAGKQEDGRKSNGKGEEGRPKDGSKAVNGPRLGTKHSHGNARKSTAKSCEEKHPDVEVESISGSSTNSNSNSGNSSLFSVSRGGAGRSGTKRHAEEPGNLIVCHTDDREYDSGGNVIRRVRFKDVPEYSEKEDAPSSQQMSKQLKQKYLRYRPQLMRETKMMNSQEGLAFRMFKNGYSQDVDGFLERDSGSMLSLRHFKAGGHLSRLFGRK